jgi:tetratricopeptide (TPR) repeat protein
MRSLIKPLLASIATCVLTFSSLALFPFGQRYSQADQIPGQVSILDLLDPALVAQSLCGEQGKKRGLFFRPELLMALSPAAHADEPEPEPEEETGPPLWDGMGTHHFDITTSSAKAQAYFNQGLALTFGFNHWEAIRAFKKAQALDPACAMCYWAEAFALGPNINDPMAEGRVDEAFTAISKAMFLKEGASRKERRLIEAMAKRYSPVFMEDRSTLDQAYSDAMGKVHRRHKNDEHIATFYAESLMDLSPWDYWERDFTTPKPHIAVAIETLEAVLAKNPDHAGSIHLYIHLMEPSTMPGRAESAAERLAGLIPGAGHLVHMPGHTFFRIGRYLDSLETNVEAVKVDEKYLKAVDGSQLYRFGYYPHNVHFVLVSAQMAGDGPTTVEFSHKLDKLIPISAVETAPFVQPIKASPMFALLQFGSREDVAAIKAPPEKLPYLRAMWHYVRGVDFAWAGNGPAALAEADAIRTLNEATEVGEGYGAGAPEQELFVLAELLVRARVDQNTGDYAAAIEKTKQAAALQSLLQYTEPPLWYYPIEQTLGALYLQAGDNGASIAAFRASLVRHPNNAWSLYGLMKAQKAASDDTLSMTQQLFDKAAAVKEDIPLDRL